MDPAACLAEADSFLRSQEWDEFADRMESYYEWRRKGGFEPPSGDSTYRGLRNVYLEMVGGRGVPFFSPLPL